MSYRITSPSKETLHIVVSDKDRSLTARALKQLQSLFAMTLRRFDARIREAHLTLSLDKGGRRRPGTRSRLAICLDNWNVVVSEARHAHATVAASRAIEKAQRELGRCARPRPIRAIAASHPH